MNLYLFNISVNEDDDALAANCDLILEAQQKFQKVKVYATHVGKYDFASNVIVERLAGGNLKDRIGSLFKVIKITQEIIRDDSEKRVLFHMNDKTAAIFSFTLKLFGVRTNLWYSHASPSLALKIANKFVSRIFTTAKEAYPLQHNDILALGQLVRAENFMKVRSTEEIVSSKMKITHVGRVSRVKNLGSLLSAIERLHSIHKIKVEFVGSTHFKDDVNYKSELERFCKEKNIDMKYLGIVNRKDLPRYLESQSIIFSGTKKAIDKSAIEGAMSGLLVISENLELLRLVGMDDFYRENCGKSFSDIFSQLSAIISIQDPSILKQISNVVSQTAKKNCGLEINANRLFENLA